MKENPFEDIAAKSDINPEDIKNALYEFIFSVLPLLARAGITWYIWWEERIPDLGQKIVLILETWNIVENIVELQLDIKLLKLYLSFWSIVQGLMIRYYYFETNTKLIKFRTPRQDNVTYGEIVDIIPKDEKNIQDEGFVIRYNDFGPRPCI